jgi:hypothetical protein
LETILKGRILAQMVLELFLMEAVAEESSATDTIFGKNFLF